MQVIYHRWGEVKVTWLASDAEKAVLIRVRVALFHLPLDEVVHLRRHHYAVGVVQESAENLSEVSSRTRSAAANADKARRNVIVPLHLLTGKVEKESAEAFTKQLLF